MSYKAILENSIMQKGKPATAGSKMLENFIAPFDATVVKRLEAANVEIIGRASMNEFGIRGLLNNTKCHSTDTPANNQTTATPANNPLTDSVNASEATQIDVFEAMQSVADGKLDFIFCNDYNGSLSYAATALGVYYIHPTYGTVSRYGLIPAVTSMDQIGIVCKTPELGFKALKIIAGHDPLDGAMLPEETRTKKPEEPLPVFEIDVVKVETDYSNVYKQVMQILCCAELSNNISRYDGIKYGYRAKEYNGLNELYTKSRTEAFASDTKLAAILGAMVLSQENYTRYYDKAMRLRRLIRDSLNFDEYDVIVAKCPILSRLCGLPSITTPEHIYIANIGREDILEAASKAVKPGDKTINESDELKAQIKSAGDDAKAAGDDAKAAGDDAKATGGESL